MGWIEPYGGSVGRESCLEVCLWQTEAVWENMGKNWMDCKFRICCWQDSTMTAKKRLLAERFAACGMVDAE